MEMTAANAIEWKAWTVAHVRQVKRTSAGSPRKRAHSSDNSGLEYFCLLQRRNQDTSADGLAQEERWIPLVELSQQARGRKAMAVFDFLCAGKSFAAEKRLVGTGTSHWQLELEPFGIPMDSGTSGTFVEGKIKRIMPFGSRVITMIDGYLQEKHCMVHRGLLLASSSNLTIICVIFSFNP